MTMVVMVMMARMTARMIMMTSMMTMMMTDSVYRPVEASDGVILFRTLLLRNTQTHLEMMTFDDNDDHDNNDRPTWMIFDYDDDNNDHDPCKVLATHNLGVSE